MLRAHQDETRLNSTLLEMLRQDFALRLPELEGTLPGGEAGGDVGSVLNAFRVKLRDLPGWEVTEQVALTNLSFTKYLNVEGSGRPRRGAAPERGCAAADGGGPKLRARR